MINTGLLLLFTDKLHVRDFEDVDYNSIVLKWPLFKNYKIKNTKFF